jgi:hypothetical protein
VDWSVYISIAYFDQFLIKLIWNKFYHYRRFFFYLTINRSRTAWGCFNVRISCLNGHGCIRRAFHTNVAWTNVSVAIGAWAAGHCGWVSAIGCAV